MRRTYQFLMAMPLPSLILLGCAAGPAYQGPAASPQTASVAIGRVTEDYSTDQGAAAMQIVAVDGHSTGLASAVRVAPGTHRFTIRHFNGYATFFGNIKYADISFAAQPGGDYRIDGSYCCGYLFGMFGLHAYDRSNGEQIAAAAANAAR
jgi:hypothetical protein